MRKFFFIFILMILQEMSLMGQSVPDSSEKILDEVVVTGTRTENSIRNLPMPIQIVSGATIEKTGSEDLLQILQMQTGLVAAVNPLGVSLQGYPNPFGTGIQMQGLDPAYTQILIDGEPLNGRNAGILNLSRVSVSNISRIEILRGPATSLYGSDALAGVINIITKTPEKNYFNSRLQYGSFNALGITLNGGIKTKKTSIELSGRRYHNDGWDLDKNIYGKTMDPSTAYSFNAKSNTQLNSKNSLSFSGRYYRSNQKNDYLISDNDVPEVINGNTIEEDKSFFGKWEHTINDKLNFIASLYTIDYGNYANAFLKKKDSLFERITFDQLLVRPEFQINVGRADRLLVAGGGYDYESVNSNRYGEKRTMDSWFIYLQKQWVFNKKWNLITGGRFDKNSLYSSQVSPKIALGFKVNPSLIIKGSVGTGFKAPDFRQQYLDFFNGIIGYTILGARELGEGLTALQKSGRLPAGVDITAYRDVNLSPEKSIGYNLGMDYTILPGLVGQVNIFRNDISHMIETYNMPFNLLNGKPIFSYKNLNRVYTEGMELNIHYKLNRNFSFVSGYQFLIAKDKDVIEQIKEKQIYHRDPVSGHSQLVRLKDYKGLYNRSKNTANLSFQYQDIAHRAGIMLSLKYRGRYGFQGINNFTDGNSILDDPREFVHGYLLGDLILNKEAGKHFNFQVGLNNLLNYTESALMPQQPGRNYFFNINYKF